MRVFDDFERDDGSPAAHAESHAEFLNRVHTPYWEAVRELIEDWFSRLPEKEKADVRARLRSRDDRQFHGAFWELYVHESLLRLGYEVVCHPPVEGTTRRPDFRARGRHSDFYVECRAASESDDEVTASRRRDRVYDLLDRLGSPNFFLWVDVEGEGATDPGTKKLRRDLEQWLDELDPDAIQQQLVETEDICSIEDFEWRADDWHLVFRPWPKAPESRGSDDIRPVGVVGPGEASMIDDVAPLRKALADKGNAYGSFDIPYIVAVRTSSPSTDESDIMDALFGRLKVELSSGPNGEIATREVRAPDGYWVGPSGWQHQSVSAVLIANSLQPWTVSVDCPTLWEHPEAEKPFLEPSPIWRQAVLRGGQLHYVEPAALPHEVLGLPLDWPEGDPSIRIRPTTRNSGIHHWTFTVESTVSHRSMDTSENAVRCRSMKELCVVTHVRHATRSHGHAHSGCGIPVSVTQHSAEPPVALRGHRLPRDPKAIPEGFRFSSLAPKRDDAINNSIATQPARHVPHSRTPVGAIGPNSSDPEGSSFRERSASGM